MTERDRWNSFVDFAPAGGGGPGPLSGLSVGVKANIAVAGLPWSAGLEAYRARIATADATVVARLRAGGARIAGTLNMDEGALGAKTDNPWYGATRNPLDETLTAGGSSGGSGAAVAAGLVDAALGTDTLGSVRIPAAYCGVYGYKPANHPAFLEGVELVDAGFDSVGTIARNPATLEAVSRAIFPIGGSSRDYDVVTIAGLGEVECEPAVRAAFDRALPVGSRAIALPASLSRIRYAGFVRAARSLGASLSDLDPASISPALRALLDRGAARSTDRLGDDEALLRETSLRVRQALDTGALLLLPTAPQAPFPLTDPAPANQADFCCLANIAGVPAISTPAGRDTRGRPVAVQYLAAPGNEQALFNLAHRREGE